MTHKVSTMEFDFLEANVGKDKTEKFRRFIARERDDAGELVFTLCPNHDGSGCTVHQYRPYSCRMYGNYRVQGEMLVSHCVFRESVVVLEKKRVKELLPHHGELDELLLNYTLYESSQTTQSLDVPSGVTEFKDIVSFASYHLSREEFALALGPLEEAVKESPDGMSFWFLAQAYEGLGRQDEALTCFEKAIELKPMNPSFHNSYANCLYFAGQRDAAQRAFQKTHELDPERSTVLGLLGTIHAEKGEYKEAIETYEKCLEKERVPSVFRFQLAYLYYFHGDKTKVRAMLTLALECPLTKESAEAAFLELDKVEQEGTM